jgi:hypothetical protein
MQHNKTTISDRILAFLQRRCEHPDYMVAVDILEGCADGIEVAYCRRCGAVKTDWNPNSDTRRFISLEHWWRRPDPLLYGRSYRLHFNRKLGWAYVGIGEWQPFAMLGASGWTPLNPLAIGRLLYCELRRRIRVARHAQV